MAGVPLRSGLGWVQWRQCGMGYADDIPTYSNRSASSQACPRGCHAQTQATKPKALEGGAGDDVSFEVARIDRDAAFACDCRVLHGRQDSPRHWRMAATKAASPRVIHRRIGWASSHVDTDGQEALRRAACQSGIALVEALRMTSVIRRKALP
jgi:hypothetical protein